MKILPIARGVFCLAIFALANHGECMEMGPTAVSIGTAQIRADGTLVLHLRAETNGAIGDALLEVKPDDPRYGAIKDHVGEIKPGEEKPILPWTE